MKRLTHYMMYPLYLLSIFSGAKSFKTNPVIGSKALNRIGLHIFRVSLSRVIMQFRWFLLTPLMPKHLRDAYHRDGYVVIPHFITRDLVAALRSDIAYHRGPARQMTQGDTATQRILLDSNALRRYPALTSCAENKILKNYLSYCGGKAEAPLLYIQRIRNGFRKGHADPQKNMHSDTFHPTMKAWLFLDDVTEARGPFTYVKGSHKWTKSRRAWEYGRSKTASTMQDKYSEKGSLRAGPDDLKQMGLPAPTSVTAEAGTLVIANTNGFHGRGQAAEGASRLEIWAYGRHAPFNPLHLTPIPGLNSIRHAALQAFWRKKDRKAAKNSNKASWHLIPVKEMTDGIKGSGEKS